MLHHPDALHQLVDERQASYRAASAARRAAAEVAVGDVVAPVITDPCVIAAISAAIPPPGTPAFGVWADEFAWRVDHDGIGAHARRVRTLAALARHLSVASVSAAVAADRSQPPVARERALGRLLVSLASARCPAAGTAAAA